TASRAIVGGKGHYLIVLTLADTDYVCSYIRGGGNKQAFLEKFRGAHSLGFDPELHLRRVGVANQTTMMRGETEEVQRRIEAAIRDRDLKQGPTPTPEPKNQNFRFFAKICGATQERLDVLRNMLAAPMEHL